MVQDLHTLLTIAGIPGPYVFVGHSLGGLLGRAFAARYPSAVAGMVLVDSFSGELWARLGAALSPENWDAFQALETAPRRELQAVYPAAELIDLDAIVREDDKHPLRTMPLVVLTRGRSLEAVVPPEALPPAFPWDVVERETRAAQESLAAAIPGARHMIAAESGHVIQLDQPELVIDAIRQVVEAVRDPASWDAPAFS
jgi:pimeloyl-ACP methyl ester carboxylesterase